MGGGKGVCSEQVQGVLVGHHKLMEEKHACELVAKARPRKRAGSVSHHLHPQSFAALAAGVLASSAVPCMLPGTKAPSKRLCVSLQAGALLPLCGAPTTYFLHPTLWPEGRQTPCDAPPLPTTASISGLAAPGGAHAATRRLEHASHSCRRVTNLTPSPCRTLPALGAAGLPLLRPTPPSGLSQKNACSAKV